MGLNARERWQLGGLVAAAALFSFVLQVHRPLGEDVGERPSVRAVLADRSSPREDTQGADLTLVVFTDYRCPACRAAHPAMKRAVAEDGKVRIVYKDWPIFGDASVRAAQVALASDLQGIYPRLHDRLMTRRANSDVALKAAVEFSGGDWRRLQEDLESKKQQILAQLAGNRKQAYELGLSGTPGYLVGPILVRGALDEGEFTRVFRKARQGR
jgi:protein-disulfide isomerase